MYLVYETLPMLSFMFFKLYFYWHYNFVSKTLGITILLTLLFK